MSAIVRGVTENHVGISAQAAQSFLKITCCAMICRPGSNLSPRLAASEPLSLFKSGKGSHAFRRE
jgi:hypothetical protein